MYSYLLLLLAPQLIISSTSIDFAILPTSAVSAIPFGDRTREELENHFGYELSFAEVLAIRAVGKHEHEREEIRRQSSISNPVAFMSTVCGCTSYLTNDQFVGMPIAFAAVVLGFIGFDLARQPKWALGPLAILGIFSGGVRLIYGIVY